MPYTHRASSRCTHARFCSSPDSIWAARRCPHKPREDLAYVCRQNACRNDVAMCHHARSAETYQTLEHEGLSCALALSCPAAGLGSGNARGPSWQPTGRSTQRGLPAAPWVAIPSSRNWCSVPGQPRGTVVAPRAQRTARGQAHEGVGGFRWRPNTEDRAADSWRDATNLCNLRRAIPQESAYEH